MTTPVYREWPTPAEAERCAVMAALHRPARHADLILDALRRFPDRVAFRQDGRDLSYGQTADLLARWVTIPLTPVGKPDKKVLRAREWTGHARRVN